MSQIRDVLQNKSLMKYSIFIAFTAALLYILYFVIRNFQQVFQTLSDWGGSLLSAFSPLFIGLFLAYLLYPLTEWISKRVLSGPFRKVSVPKVRLLSILLTYLLVFGAIIAIVYAFSFLILGKFVFSGFSSLWDTLIRYLSEYETVIKSWVGNLEIDGLSEPLNNLADSIIRWITEHFSTSALIGFVGSVGGSILNALLGIMVSIYLLKDKDFFLGLFNRWLRLVFKAPAENRIRGTLQDVNGVVSLFIRGALLDALIVAILSAIGLSIMGLEFAVFIGAFAGIANIIPYFGPFLGMVPAFIVGAFTGGLGHGILAVAILFGIQQIDANIIYPKVVGSTTGLHPLFVLLAVAVSGSFFGIPGMILAVPTAGILQVFILKWVGKREKEEISP
jgi:predicted PurR-regulated permease PerM